MQGKHTETDLQFEPRWASVESGTEFDLVSEVLSDDGDAGATRFWYNEVCGNDLPDDGNCTGPVRQHESTRQQKATRAPSAVDRKQDSGFDHLCWESSDDGSGDEASVTWRGHGKFHHYIDEWSTADTLPDVEHFKYPDSSSFQRRAAVQQLAADADDVFLHPMQQPARDMVLDSCQPCVEPALGLDFKQPGVPRNICMDPVDWISSERMSSGKGLHVRVPPSGNMPAPQGPGQKGKGAVPFAKGTSRLQDVVKDEGKASGKGKGYTQVPKGSSKGARDRREAPPKLTCVPSDEAPTNPGSQIHLFGNCVACRDFVNNGWCARGDNCQFCHVKLHFQNAHYRHRHQIRAKHKNQPIVSGNSRDNQQSKGKVMSMPWVEGEQRGDWQYMLDQVPANSWLWDLVPKKMSSNERQSRGVPQYAQQEQSVEL